MGNFTDKDGRWFDSVSRFCLLWVQMFSLQQVWLTVNMQSGQTCDRPCRIRGHTWVFSFVGQKTSRDLQLTGVTIMWHPEDIGLSDLPVITEPGDLQAWRNNDNHHFQSHQPETFSQGSLWNKDVLQIEGYLLRKSCTGSGQDVPLRL